MISSNPSGYQPQSSDTVQKLTNVLMPAFSQMPAWEKAHLLNEATKEIQQWTLIGIRNQYPNATSAETRFYLAVRWLGKKIAERLYKNSQGKIVDADLVRLTLKMTEILDALIVSYLIGGSVVSSILGKPRATLDVDIVADLQLSHV